MRSLAARIALLVSVLTMVAVAVSATGIAVATQYAVDSGLRQRQAEINANVVKDLDEAGKGATSWADTSPTANQLARTYAVRIVITTGEGQVQVDTGSGPTPPLVGSLRPGPEPAQLYVASTVTATVPVPLIALLALIMMVAAALVAIPLARSLTKSLDLVGATVHAIRNGDLGARVDVMSPDEIADLAEGVNAMAEELQAGERRRLQQSADIAHELRSPLTNIRNHLDAFSDGLLPLTVENLRALDTETQRLSMLVDDLATVSSLEEGTLRLHRRASDLAALVDAALEVRRASALSRHISLARAGTCETIDIDPDRVSQILGNLLDNAIRFAPDGGSVLVEVAQQAQTVKIRVVDSGPGIDPDDLERVFERLWRADQARAGSTNRGLGLAIARGLAIAHSGDIRAENLPGGCSFTVTLPRDDSTVCPRRVGA
ncbi:MAG: ATP-binding protein [Actinobacteria bacterium]|nr:ATP-binding protein [Actinomycetota bacterium]